MILKANFLKRLMNKYGKKALIVYLCWSVIKGLLLIFLGSKLFG